MAEQQEEDSSLSFIGALVTKVVGMPRPLLRHC